MKNIINVINYLKKRKYKIGLCLGCFDIVHDGHITHFSQAKEQCDVLLVALTADEHVNKGKNRPYLNVHQRKSVVSSLRMVDYAFKNTYEDTIELLSKLKPNIYIKGSDYKSGNYNKKFDEEKLWCELNNVHVHYTQGDTNSSTKISNLIYNV
jgi:rfaE bifunctional protein nucleotidyltransferase chain/domain